jgi:ABC-type multidrug transport system ATPase subunit
VQIDIRGLRKVYAGGIVALDGLDLTIPPGVFGLLGPNGSGKTTLMRILATLLDPTEGQVTIDGLDVRRDRAAIRSILGYMPQEFGFYPSLTAYETLDYFALLCRVTDPEQRRERIYESLRQANLTECADRRVATLSGGMRQRLGIAQALLNDPRVLIVDEPTSGLDPEERVRLRSLIAELAAGRVVILSTHIVSDVEMAAERLAVLRNGRLLFAGHTSEMLAPLSGKTWIVDIEDDELSQVREDYFVTGVFRSATGMQVRVIADAVAHPRSREATPTLDDAYVSTMQQTVSLVDME